MDQKDLTCSSSDKDAANRRGLVLGSSLACFSTGLSGGVISELGVVAVSLLEIASETSSNLSKIGSIIRLSGDSAIVAGPCKIEVLCRNEKVSRETLSGISTNE